MKSKDKILLAILLIAFSSFINEQTAQEFPVLKGEYFGQKPPGIIPKLFVPGIVSTGANDMNICFSPAGDEMYYFVTGPAFRPRADLGLKADILFMPVSGCGFGDIGSVKKGDYYTMDRFSAQYVFPMHAQGNPLQYQQFTKEAKERGYKNTFNCAEFPGDCFAVKTRENERK